MYKSFKELLEEARSSITKTFVNTLKMEKCMGKKRKFHKISELQKEVPISNQYLKGFQWTDRK